MDDSNSFFSAGLSETEIRILTAVRALKYGSVEVTVHDAHVVQVERREKIRLPAVAGKAAASG